MLKLFHAGWSLCHHRELAGKQQREMLHKNTVQMDELLFIKMQLLLKTCSFYISVCG